MSTTDDDPLSIRQMTEEECQIGLPMEAAP